MLRLGFERADQLVEALGERSHALVLEHAATSSRSMPSAAIASSVRWAASGSASTVRARVPWSSNASSVASGIVLTVSGPMSVSTYNVSG